MNDRLTRRDLGKTAAAAALAASVPQGPARAADDKTTLRFIAYVTEVGGSSRNSMYASSSTQITWAGRLSINATNSAFATRVPVGLFGLATNTSFVFAVIASRIAFKLCVWPANGTSTHRA